MSNMKIYKFNNYSVFDKNNCGVDDVSYAPSSKTKFYNKKGHIVEPIETPEDISVVAEEQGYKRNEYIWFDSQDVEDGFKIVIRKKKDVIKEYTTKMSNSNIPKTISVEQYELLPDSNIKNSYQPVIKKSTVVVYDEVLEIVDLERDLMNSDMFRSLVLVELNDLPDSKFIKEAYKNYFFTPRKMNSYGYYYDRDNELPPLSNMLNYQLNTTKDCVYSLPVVFSRDQVLRDIAHLINSKGGNWISVVENHFWNSVRNIVVRFHAEKWTERTEKRYQRKSNGDLYANRRFDWVTKAPKVLSYIVIVNDKSSYSSNDRGIEFMLPKLPDQWENIIEYYDYLQQMISIITQDYNFDNECE